MALTPQQRRAKRQKLGITDVRHASKGQIATARKQGLLGGKPSKPKAPKPPADPFAKNPLYQPGTPLSGKALHDAAQSIVNAELGPKRAALSTQAGQTAAQGGALINRASDYYRQLAEREAGALSTQQALASRLKGTVEQANAQGRAGIDKAASDANAIMDRQGQMTGVTGVRDQLASAIAQAQTNQAQTAQAASSQAANLSGNYGAYTAESAQAQQARGADVIAQLANRMAGQQKAISDQRAALDASAGDEFTKQLTGLRQNEFNNQATTAGLGLKQADLQATVANQQANQDIARSRISQSDRANRRQVRTTQRGQTLTHQDRVRANQIAQQKANQGPAGGKGGAKSFTPTQVRGAQTKLRSLSGTVQTGRRFHPTWTPQQHIDALIGKKGVDPLLAAAAVETAFFGGVTDVTQRKLARAYGIRPTLGHKPTGSGTPRSGR